MFLFPCFQASKNFTQLAGQNGTPWSRGLTGISALLPNLPHIRGIYGQLVDFGHCSSSFWPQGPALNRFLCNFVPRPKDCNRDRCQGRLAPVVKIRTVEQAYQHAERRNEIKLSKIDKDLCRLLNALFILQADHSSYNE